MTLNETKLPIGNLFDSLVQNFRTGLVFIAKVAIAGLLIFAAGVLAVATAVAGLVIAGIALLVGFVGRSHVSSRMRQSRRDWQDGETVTLEARNTSHGWTVE